MCTDILFPTLATHWFPHYRTRHGGLNGATCFPQAECHGLRKRMMGARRPTAIVSNKVVDLWPTLLSDEWPALLSKPTIRLYRNTFVLVALIVGVRDNDPTTKSTLTKVRDHDVEEHMRETSRIKNPLSDDHQPTHWGRACNYVPIILLHQQYCVPLDLRVAAKLKRTNAATGKVVL